MKKIKQNLVKKYGKKPTISYYYYLYNAVDYCGEERVRKSFESLANQGSEVLVGHCDTNDKTEKIALEYGFKPLKVEKTKYCVFPESKIRNKCIIESKSNFVIPVNIHVEYEKRLTNHIKRLLRKTDITKKYIHISYKFQSSDGSTERKKYGFSIVFYKPYLLLARGYDERTFYAFGSQKYGSSLLKQVFRLTPLVYKSNMVHKYHNHVKLEMLGKILNNSDIKEIKMERSKLVNILITNLKKDFKTNVKNVVNSYW